ncbi:hypothetical protein Q1695_013935 [Nippostrongylus brasiliensis]|nr:hypothetical protein Q1695_013935 [Nippostrongylus brasiliensis]
MSIGQNSLTSPVSICLWGVCLSGRMGIEEETMSGVGVVMATLCRSVINLRSRSEFEQMKGSRLRALPRPTGRPLPPDLSQQIVASRPTFPSRIL